MKIRLPKTEKKVIVDEKRRTVTTLLLGTNENPALKFVGVAKCSPEDTFDVEIGAYSRPLTQAEKVKLGLT